MTHDTTAAAGSPALPPSMGATPEETLSAFVSRAEADPAVAGLLLCGSRAYDGVPTVHSDYDVHVVLRDDRPSGLEQLDRFRSEHLDLVVVRLSEFRLRGMPGDPSGTMRYTYVRAQVLLDRLGGQIAELLGAKRTLREEEARDLTRRCLDAYVNQAYRSLKSHRDGRPAPAHLDAAESVPFALAVIFSLHGRVVPFNKYLEWELVREPLGAAPEWRAERLLPQVRRVLADGDAAAQRALFAGIERAAREAGHGDVLDSWGDSLGLFRSTG